MTTILNPQAMQKVLTHSKEYERAIGLLNKRWDPDEQPIFRNVLQSADVQFARQLQIAGLIKGKVDLSSYQEVNQLMMQHDSWFSESARKTLLSPFFRLKQIYVNL